MTKTVIVTAHGKVDPDLSNAFDIPIDILTCSRFGEYHAGKLLNFPEISIFDKPSYLYKYVLNSGDNYTNKGKLYIKGNKIPNIILTPLEQQDPVKIFSWQKPYVINHLTKLCRYELSDNPKYAKEITPFNINTITLSTIKTIAGEDKDLSLLSSVDIIEEYEASFNYATTTINNHTCAFTVNKDKSVIMIDYEQEPKFDSKEWKLTDFLSDLNNFSQNEGKDLLGEAPENLILKACLSD